MINPYLAGKNQYGGSSAANKGMTLNPTGYMQRESDKRSQLAQNFMQNQQQNNVMQPQVGTVTGLTNNFDQRTATGRIIPPPVSSFQPPPAPNISAPAGQPADSQYNAEQYQASADYQNQARQLMEARQNAELNYANQTRGLQQVLDKLPGQLRSEAARRGLLRSTYFSGNLENQLTDVGNQIESALADQNFADKSYTSGLADLSGNYSGLMALAAQTLASRNAANAGKLGLGTANPADKQLSESQIGKKIQEMINGMYGNTNYKPTSIPAPKPAPRPPTAPAAGSVPAGTYRQGTTGSGVKAIQNIVGVNPDGVFGPKTLAAVKAWQQQHGLVADGIVGPKTLAAMNGGR